ncbi:MAG: glycosyl hydrolase [Gemmatimonadetes bacterium]|nr:glycosyl hydrolase [Gemmatimonadota bacterium]MYB97060.1 glycosyl hydrolase [Gemmatimonadota bacterium]
MSLATFLPRITRPAMRSAIISLTIAAAALAGDYPPPLAAQSVDTLAFKDLSYRMAGPYRGGRSTAATGFLNDADRWLMGTTGGGVWETTDNGVTWENISDGYFGGSIGAVRVADSDQNVIYVGEGSACIRGNTSTGRGAWKSMDDGRTWSFIGLPEAGQIPRIEVHPHDHELVYVAALGHPFGKNPERGIFRSRDGGDTWEHVLALNDSTGASDLAMDMTNPRILYAGMWRGERKPWALISGAEEGGVYKTTDGGDTWTKLGGGLPEGVVGKVGVTVSPADPDRVWAIIEAEPDGGVYRSNDGGATWTRTNSNNNLRQRAWYYTHIQADPVDPNTVYALNTRLYRSVDAGATFEMIPVPHGDVHDLWIHPSNPSRMVVANDGGAQVTVNNGETWSTYYNQPTAEFYDVIVDNGFPYRLYGAQQDNTTISVPAWSDVNTLYPKQHWQNVGGCETGPIALHPDHPHIVYAGCYGGVMDRYDLDSGQRRNIMLYPQLQLGMAAKDLLHRFQWVSPMVVSRHDPTVIYHGSQHVNRSRDEGATWETISPDLTTDNPAHQEQAGGPINADVTGVEIYNVVFSIAESPFDTNEIWAGSDDGRMHITRDGGADWTDITPDGMPELGTVDEIELSVHRAGRAYIAVQRYRIDDFDPYIFRTDDFGASWTQVTGGIPDGHPVRTVREDPGRDGLLFAGTEFGVFVSFDAGDSWQSFQRNLPITPVTGMRVAHDDLILSTQGRSFWIMDDISPLREIEAAVAAGTHLFQPRDVRRLTNVGTPGLAELNPEPRAPGAQIHYYLAEEPDEEVRIEVVDPRGEVVRTFHSDSAAAEEADGERITKEAGLNRIAWALHYAGPELPEGAVVWGYSGGVKAPPGTYTVRLTVGETMAERDFELLPDPRIPEVTAASYQDQFRVAILARDSINSISRAIDDLAAIRAQVEEVMERARAADQEDALQPLADTLTAKSTGVTDDLMQTRNRSNQDPIRFPPRLDNQWLELYGRVTGSDGYISGGPEGAPHAGTMQRLEDLLEEWNAVRVRYLDLLENELRRFNEAVERLGLPAVVLPRRGRIVS